MRIKPDQLQNHLTRGLAGCYMVHGDEPLLQQEICDAIRTKARQEGFLERDYSMQKDALIGSKLLRQIKPCHFFLAAK